MLPSFRPCNHNKSIYRHDEAYTFNTFDVLPPCTIVKIPSSFGKCMRHIHLLIIISIWWESVLSNYLHIVTHFQSFSIFMLRENMIKTFYMSIIQICICPWPTELTFNFLKLSIIFLEIRLIHHLFDKNDVTYVPVWIKYTNKTT